MNRPYAVQVSDQGGHWDEWLVGAESPEEAVGFVRGYWLLSRKRIVALDLTKPKEFLKAVGVFGVPKVVDQEGPHFLPVPAASGFKNILRRASTEPTVGVKRRAIRKRPRAAAAKAKKPARKKTE